MAENMNKEQEVATPVETSDRGLFDFTKKDDEQKAEVVNEEKFASEFDDKVQVSEPPPPTYDDGQDIKHDSLLDKFHKADAADSSSSSSDEEGDDEEKKRRKQEKREKKGLKEKLIEKLPGHKNEEEKTTVSTETPQVHDVVYSEPSHPEEDVEKKGFLDKIKEKLPGQKKPEDHHDEVVHETVVVEGEGEGEEKKGIMDRIKEKIPGFGPKVDEEDKKDHE
ncbi:hypothetical protein RND81_03G011500 [Saponaria officinalis]|uniref:Dehydrin n=1 Tax=Saponaria officinalis TaxID=3572 RepID=A0AAW1M2T6_SAPOF